MLYIDMAEMTNGVEGGTGTPPIKDKKLPELQLTQLARSKGKVVTDFRDICYFEDYTVLLDKGLGFCVFNEQMEEVQANSPLGRYFNWKEFGQQKNLQYIYRNGHGKGAYKAIEVRELPFLLRQQAQRCVDEYPSDNYVYIPGMDNITFIADRMTTFLDRYILFQDTENDSEIVFDTKDNETGMILSPKDWVILGFTDNIPIELQVELEKIMKPDKGLKMIINNSYYSITNEAGINIFDNNGILLFTKNISSVERNITVDPKNPNIIYFCKSNNPTSIQKIDVSGDSKTWEAVSAEIPGKYESVSGLQLDPSGRFFLFYSKKDFVMISKDTLEEVIKVPGLSHVKFDKDGHIRAVDRDGYLVIYEANFDQLIEEMDKRRIASLAEDVDIDDIFKKAAGKNKNTEDEGLERLDPVIDTYQQKFDEQLKNINDRQGVDQARQVLTDLKVQLKANGLKNKEIEYIISRLEKPILMKEKEFATEDADTAIKSIEKTLEIGLSLTSVAEAKSMLDKIKGSEALLDKDLRIKLSETIQKFDRKRLEFFTKQGDEMTKNLEGRVEAIKTELDSFTGKPQMDDWLDFRYPEYKKIIDDLARSIPVDASEAYKKVMAIRAKLQEMVENKEKQFKLEYGKIREKAVERNEAIVDSLKGDIGGFVERFKGKGFTTRAQAEQYLDSSEAKKTLTEEIDGLTGIDSDLKKKMKADLEVQLSNALAEIDRGSKNSVTGSGQQMITIGEVQFPRWEAKTKQKTERELSLIFEEDSRSRGPGVKPSEFQGDISVAIKNSEGKIDRVRLYEGWQEENEWRFGIRLYDKIGLSNPPSFVTAGEFGRIANQYTDWSRGENSKLRKSLREKQQALKEFYKTRPTNNEEMSDWIIQRDKMITEYASFYMESHIPLLKRIDQIRNEPEIEHSNGKGMVPEWQPHWTTDADTEKNLETMARGLKMQLELQEGCYNLKGHAGVGKDVLVKMFCSLTNRPYFGIDGSKWTTEYELSEDVQLESENGASKTIRVPSAVLNGITTPGAVIYFNEFNAMPEQTQIFLHSLMDEKRSLTLKTSSGRTIKALPSVLMVSSMNPNYPGTFDVQFATRSRMTDQNINYPALTRPPENGDSNPNPIYNVSEALRMARGIDSLEGLTYEATVERNEFVKMWDHYVNGIDNGSPEPNPTQRFDMETCLAVLHFASKLRENFMKFFEKTSDSRNALPVSLPMTGRELRRIAYGLSQIESERKATMNPEQLARDLIEIYYLEHYDKTKDRQQIKDAMSSWTSQKRVNK